MTGVWANESVERLNQLHAMLPDQVMYPLMKAQALVINHQKQEAEWILEEFKREWPDHHTPGVGVLSLYYDTSGTGTGICGPHDA